MTEMGTFVFSGTTEMQSSQVPIVWLAMSILLEQCSGYFLEPHGDKIAPLYANVKPLLSTTVRLVMIALLILMNRND